MGNKSAKICSVKRNYADPNTLEGSLSRNGFNRFPGTGMRLVPYKEANGTYRTGLDPEALYIKRMPQGEQEIEKTRVTQLREELEALTGLDLSPKSEYYTKMFDSEYGENGRARVIKLADGDNIFNLGNAFDSIQFAWLRVHPQIAGSWEHYRTGRAGNVQFFVSDPEVENQIMFSEKQAINKSIVELDTMDLEKRKKVARLLGLPVGERSTEYEVYNLLDNFIKQGDVKLGEFKGQKSVRLFADLVAMQSDNLFIKDLIKQAFQYNIYRSKSGRIYEGQVEVAKTEIELYERLLSSKYQDDLLALEEKVKTKKSIKQ